MKRDPMAFFQVFPSMLRNALAKPWAAIVVWFRGTLLGRMIWAAANVGKDFKTKLPEYKFELTREQAEYVETVMCKQDLRVIKGMKAFYHKYPRGMFNLPPYGTGPIEEVMEASALAEAATFMLYPPEIAADGKKYLPKNNPFIQMLARQYGEMGGPAMFTPKAPK